MSSPRTKLRAGHRTYSDVRPSQGQTLRVTGSDWAAQDASGDRDGGARDGSEDGTPRLRESGAGGQAGVEVGRGGEQRGGPQDRGERVADGARAAHDQRQHGRGPGPQPRPKKQPGSGRRADDMDGGAVERALPERPWRRGGGRGEPQARPARAPAEQGLGERQPPVPERTEHRAP